MRKVYNFSAGPSMLPAWVLEQASRDLPTYRETGQSVMEMSHRSAEFAEIFQDAQERLRRLLGIPENYKVLFLQGGASSQFAMVPLNLMTGSKKADYITTGQWSKKALAEAKRFGNAREVASSADQTFSYIPDLSKIHFDPEADYVHITLNNTIYGTAYHQLPNTEDVPLVADISSCALSGPLEVSKFGVLYAGAQKNMGPAGLTVVILREDLIHEPQPNTPTMFTYQIHAEHQSMFNTPPCYSIYVCGLVLQWLEEQIGGLENMRQINEEKAALLYDFLDQSKLFRGTAERASRSLMNVPFVTGSKELDEKFVGEAKQAGLINLKGHRSVGGMRASIYNAMPTDGVKALVEFMARFEKENR